MQSFVEVCASKRFASPPPPPPFVSISGDFLEKDVWTPHPQPILAGNCPNLVFGPPSYQFCTQPLIFQQNYLLFIILGLVQGRKFLGRALWLGQAQRSGPSFSTIFKKISIYFGLGQVKTLSRTSAPTRRGQGAENGQKRLGDRALRPHGKLY